MKKVISLILSAVLCLSVFFCAVSAEPAIDDSEAEWNYYNSIMVEASFESSETPNPSDFPEIDCTGVYVVEFHHHEKSTDYILILKLATSDNRSAEKALKAITANSAVESAKRNKMNYAGGIKLNYSELYIKKGSQASVVESGYINGEYDGRTYELIIISIDSQVFDENDFYTDSLKDYGIFYFDSQFATKPPKYDEQYENVKVQKDDRVGIYNGWVSGVETNEHPKNPKIFVDTMTKLSDCEFVKGASIHIDYILYGSNSFNEVYYNWYSENDAVVEVASDENPETAHISAKECGESVVHITEQGTMITGECLVKVYDEKNSPGNVDSEGTTEASDALLALQAAVGRTELSENAAAVADINNDGSVTAADALMILQIAVGKPAGF